MTNKNLLLEYDESVDAAYITVKEADWDHQIRLNDSRGSTTRPTAALSAWRSCRRDGRA